MSRPNFERLRQAFAIIDGIPAKVFDLDAWVSQGKGATCGTIACAGGWLAMHPDMKALGLNLSSSGMPQLKSASVFTYGTQALEQTFGLSCLGSGREDIFSSSGAGYKDGEVCGINLTHKQMWKRRVLRLFQEFGEPFDPKVGEGLHLDAR